MADSARILLFTGDGKGKTTAALGLVLRACGHGLRTLVVQFVKSDASTGEVAGIKHLPGVEIVQAGCGFIPPETDPAFDGHRKAAQRGLDLAADALTSGKYEIVILDEICVAVSRNLLSGKKVEEVIRKAAPGTSVVLTGRNAPENFVALADTVTEMRAVKHGLQIGRKAQKGIEH